MSKMKISFLGAVVLSAATLVGCNSVSNVGTIGGTRYEAVRSTHPFGPSTVSIVAVDENGTQSVVSSFGSDGLFPSAVGAAGNVVAAEVFDGDTHSTNVSGSVNVKQNNGRRTNDGPLSDRPPR